MDAEKLRELALFAGAGGGILGGYLLGWECVCAVEIEDYPRRVLLARQRDGILPRFPIWDDVTTFDGYPWRGRVDVVSGGFPCQDISAAGKGAGIRGAKSGLWAEFARIIGEVQPRYVFVENSPMLIIRGLDCVLGDLAALGYDAEWGVLSSGETGGDCLRARIWIVGCPRGERIQNGAIFVGPMSQSSSGGTRSPPLVFLEGLGVWRRKMADVDGATNALAAWVERVRAVGNGQDPILAASAFRILRERIEREA